MSAPHHVLLVEDNPGDARLIELYLQDEYASRFESRHVSSLASALETLQEGHWDVVLLDLGLPDSQGFDTFEQLHKAAKALPIVVMSGQDDESLARKAVQAGAQDYLVKGRVDAYTLGRALYYAIERRDAEGRIHFQAELLDSVGEAVIATTLDGSVAYWNRFAETLYGWSRDEAMGKNVLELTPSDMTRKQAAEIMQHLREGKRWSGDFEVRRKDGSSFIARVTDTPIMGMDGSLLGIVGVSSDVTAERDMAEALGRSEADYRGLFENAHDAIFILDPENEEVLACNERACEVYGFSRDELLGMSMRDITANVEQGKVHVARTLAEGEMLSFETTHYQKDGRELLIEINASVIGYRGRQAILSLNRDVSERERARRALQASNEKALKDYDELLGKLGRLAQEVSLAREVQTIYRSVFAFLIQLMPCNGGFVALYDAETEMRRCAYVWAEGVEEDASALPPLPMNDSLQSQAIRQGEPVVVGDYAATQETNPYVDLGDDINPDYPQSVLVAPMSVLGRVIGALEVQSTMPDAYNDYHVTALRMAANLVAIALENVQFLEREQSLRKEAQRSERRYRELLEQASDGIFVFDEERAIVEVNNQACKLTGYTREELLTMRVPDLLDPDELAERPSHLEEIRKSSPLVFERTMLRKDRTAVPIEVSSALMSSGLFQSIVRDISERKRSRQALEDSQRILQSSLDAQAAHIAILNEQGTIVAVNEAWRRYARDNGYQGDHAGVGNNYLQVCDLVTGDEVNDARQAAQGIRQVIEGTRDSLRLEYPCHSPSEQSWFELQATRFSGQGKVPAVIVHENVTVRKLAELLELDRRKVLEMITENAPLDDVFDQLVAMIHRQIPNAACLLMKPNQERLFPVATVGLSEEYLRELAGGIPISADTGPCGIAAYQKRAVVTHDIETDLDNEVCREIFVRHGVRAVWSQPVLSGDGEVLGTFGLFYSQPTVAEKDELKVLELAGQLAAVAIEHQQLLENLAYQATHDSLTGLANRVLLEDHLQLALAQARREKEQVAVLFLDLDNFKKVNDSLGHQVGDMLLKAVAERLLACTREHDTVARVGGDEFALVLTAIDTSEGALRVARKLMSAFSTPFDLLGRDAYVDVSIGISVYPQDGDDVTTLLRNADTAMYRTKLLGKNNVVLFSSDMNAAALERLELDAELRRALKGNEFELHYQPQIDLQTGALVGAEALVRWRHPQRGLIPPGQFIPIVEESGLIIPLGEWVLKEACRQRKVWLDAGLGDFYIAVNVSAKQFNRPEFVDTVRQVVAASGLEPHYVELEVTESVVMRDIADVARELGALKAFGVRVAIDDFGTGYSSLAYLKRLPVDVLKVDRSFVQELSEDDAKVNAFTLAEALVTLAHDLGLAVVAEGVETDEQLRVLRKMGCDTAQGYYYARPQPAEAFAEVSRQYERVNGRKRAS